MLLVDERSLRTWALVVVAAVIGQSARAETSVPRPTYLDRMPTIERVASGARAPDPLEAKSLQAAALFVLVDDFMPTLRGEPVPRHPDDVALERRYRDRIVELNREAEQTALGTATPSRSEAMAFSAQRYLPRVNALRRDEKFRRVVIERLVGTEWYADYQRRVQDRQLVATQAQPPLAPTPSPPRGLPSTGGEPTNAELAQALLSAWARNMRGRVDPARRGVIVRDSSGTRHLRLLELNKLACGRSRSGLLCEFDVLAESRVELAPGTAAAQLQLSNDPLVRMLLGGVTGPQREESRYAARLTLANGVWTIEDLERQMTPQEQAQALHERCLNHCEAVNGCNSDGEDIFGRKLRGSAAGICGSGVQICLNQCVANNR